VESNTSQLYRVLYRVEIKKGQYTQISLGNIGDEQLFSCHKREKPQAPTPQTPVRNRQTRKVANAKGLNRNTNLT